MSSAFPCSTGCSMRSELDLTGKQPKFHFFCVCLLSPLVSGHLKNQEQLPQLMDFPCLFPNDGGNKPIPPLSLGSFPQDQFFCTKSSINFFNATNWSPKEFPFLAVLGNIPLDIHMNHLRDQNFGSSS